MLNSRELTFFIYLSIGFWWMASALAADRPPAEIYDSICAKCHEGGVPQAPHSVEFQMLGPQAILYALESGVMQAQGAALSPGERRSVAEFLGGARDALPQTSISTIRLRSQAGD
jgi:mono/diheme cytochrome c family protein